MRTEVDPWFTLFDPTAVQAFVDVHETPRSLAPPVVALGGARLGVCSSAQAEPSHRSASASEPVAPTAVQADGAAHETLSRRRRA
jgi:hypothetical protein